MNKHTFTPSLERLEGRALAAAYPFEGTAWPRVTALTFSVVPDGTDWNGTPSSLGVMGHEVGPSWRSQLRAAVRRWGDAIGVSFREVPDSGAPEDAPGLTQGDRRFGDVRFGGVAMGANSVLALASPPPPDGRTGAGDVLFNTSYQWGKGGFDFASVVTHEFGHALGLGHSTAPGNVMAPAYAGPVAALGPGDVAAVRKLYGYHWFIRE